MLERTHIPDVLALIQLKSGSHGSSDHANYFAFSAKTLGCRQDFHNFSVGHINAFLESRLGQSQSVWIVL